MQADRVIAPLFHVYLQYIRWDRTGTVVEIVDVRPHSARLVPPPGML